MDRGLGFYTLAGIVMVSLNVTGAVELPWALVLAPVWVPALVAVAMAFICLVLAVTLSMIGD